MHLSCLSFKTLFIWLFVAYFLIIQKNEPHVERQPRDTSLPPQRASSDDLTVAVDAMRKEKEGNVKEGDDHSAIRLAESYPMNKSIKFGDTDEILQI